MGKITRNHLIAGAGLATIYGVMSVVANRKMEDEGIDDDNPYINSAITGEKDRPFYSAKKVSVYEGKIKRVFDKALSFGGLVALSPLFLGISFIVWIDDPGPVFFTQKRIGKDKHYVMIHKFRSMSVSTPHDVPTHKLSNPEQYITRVGRVLRKTSLDELPQIWDIFRGRMSVIGPRPALWNQDDLVAERDNYGANSVMPGLTGLAQIKGRDELEITDKARIDGEYVKKLRAGGVKAFNQDVKCFVGTIVSVIRHDGVVEGGTSNLPDSTDNWKMYVAHGLIPPTADETGFEDYGFKKKFSIDKSRKVRILITGAGSYIGESFRKYCSLHYTNIDITIIDMVDENWEDGSFEGFDTVFHVAGIAHADVGKVKESEKAKYYAINTDLAIKVAKKAKESGVKQFILMSSMIVYGGKEYIDEYTIPCPSNFYGDSKWQADKGVRELSSAKFKVCVLRPPMIYGRGSKGNYLILSKIAKKVPIFPNIENKRSMLYIGNFCEFVALLALCGESGIYFPQNAEYTKTADMVQTIGAINHKSVWRIKMLNPAILIAGKIPGKISTLVKKAFGNNYYDRRLSVYEGLEYQRISLEDSIKQTESVDANRRKSVLILVNHEVVIYNFRLELVERLLADGYKVHISTPPGERIDELCSLGAVCHDITIDRHGMNPAKEIGILYEYRRLIKEIKPVIVLGYTIKPNIYGAMAARAAHVPFVANITGLGTAVENNSWKQQMMVLMYKAAFTNIQRVFFQNKENILFFKEQNIAVSKHALLPGSGVNLIRYSATPLPPCGDGKTGEPVRFAFISRIMKEKGIEQYLIAAERIKATYAATEFHVCGFCEAEYDGRLDELDKAGVIIYHGMIKDVAGFMSQMHCIIHPTYYPEGLSNVLLEASACGRPIITCDRSGCREVVDGNGYLIPEKNVDKLVESIKSFIHLSQSEKQTMGRTGRKLVEDKFDRKLVVDAYMKEISKAEIAGASI